MNISSHDDWINSSWFRIGDNSLQFYFDFAIIVYARVFVCLFLCLCILL